MPSTVNALNVAELKYKAFISYSHRDERWATWLHKALETYRPPKQVIGQATPYGTVPRTLSPVFRDREELPSATDLGAILRAALEQSSCLVVICSPHSAQSRWVNEEILAFKRLGRADRIFCLIVGGEPYASSDPQQFARECFPPAVRFKLDAQGELSADPEEPIAADARDGKDGKNNAKLKLIAGILGVGFDSLRRREQQRRQRRLVLIAGGATAGMILTTTLAATALVARANAERQRLRAEAEAETARQTTAFLVDLFRVSDPSEARGNSVTAREMLDKGAGRIDTELKAQPAIQATLMDTVGTVYMRLGLYQQARPLLEGALQRREQLDATEPGQFAGSLNRLGEVLTLQAQYEPAERHYREALAANHSRSETYDPAVNVESLTGLASVLAKQGRLEEAEKTLRAALTAQTALLGESHADIARTMKELAAVIYQRGNLTDAIPTMERALRMQRELRGELPHPDTVAMMNDLGVLLHASGQYDRAEQLLGESLEMARRLLGEKHPDIAMALNNLAFLLHDKGDYTRAESTYRQALEMQRELVGPVHPDVAMSNTNLAFILHDRGDRQGALRTLEESRRIFAQLFNGDHPETARVLHTMGYWLLEQGSYEEAQRSMRQALEMRQRLLGDDHPDVASTLTHLAMLQVATQRYSEAEVTAQRATTIFTTTLGAQHWRTAVAKSAWGAALTGLGRLTDAERMLLASKATLDADAAALPDYKRAVESYLETLVATLRRPLAARGP